MHTLAWVLYTVAPLVVAVADCVMPSLVPSPVHLLMMACSLVFCARPLLCAYLQEITLNHETFEDVVGCKDRFYGVTVGRVANRIRNGRFSLEGKVRPHSGGACAHVAFMLQCVSRNMYHRLLALRFRCVTAGLPARSELQWWPLHPWWRRWL